MEISTSTNICAFQPGRERLPVEFSIETCAKAGYRVLDINFCMGLNPDSPMRGDGWEAYVRSIGALAQSHGIRFNQSHLPYYDVDSERGTERARQMEQLIERSIIGSAMLGAKWCVTHPFTAREGKGVSSVSLEKNLEYFGSHLKTAWRAGVGIALENDFEYHAGQPRGRVYCAAMEELIGLCDAFSDPAVGVCYDFGHANLTGGFHRHNLNLLGGRLKALHVQDNHGEKDEHLMPFFGSIDWKDAMAGLADIRFPGDLTFEIQEWGRYLPRELKYIAAEQSLVIGRRLVAYYEEALREK